MNAFGIKAIAVGTFLAGALVSGVLVTAAGRPLNPGLFNLHKIVAVVLFVLFSIVARQFFRSGLEAGGALVTMIALTAVFFLALLVTGGLLSFEREWSALVLRLHQMAPILSVASTALGIFMMFRRIA